MLQALIVVRVIIDITELYSRSVGPRGLWLRSAAARLLGLRVRIPPVAWIFVSCEYCVLSGRVFCDELIPLRRGVLPSVVCLSVIRYNNNPLDLKGVGRSGILKNMERYDA
jgi:hypothetical protein